MKEAIITPEKMLHEMFDNITCDMAITASKIDSVLSAMSTLFECAKPNKIEFEERYTYYSDLLEIAYDYSNEQKEALEKIRTKISEYELLTKQGKFRVE